jgi:hypothetical protein
MRPGLSVVERFWTNGATSSWCRSDMPFAALDHHSNAGRGLVVRRAAGRDEQKGRTGDRFEGRAMGGRVTFFRSRRSWGASRGRIAEKAADVV